MNRHRRRSNRRHLLLSRRSHRPEHHCSYRASNPPSIAQHSQPCRTDRKRSPDSCRPGGTLEREGTQLDGCWRSSKCHQLCRRRIADTCRARSAPAPILGFRFPKGPVGSVMSPVHVAAGLRRALRGPSALVAHSITGRPSATACWHFYSLECILSEVILYFPCERRRGLL
jgi:hypothetical protein